MLPRKAQTISEYALVIGLAVAVLSAVDICVQRSLKAKYKDAVDTVGQVYGLNQYEPYYAKSEIYTNSSEGIEGSYVTGESQRNITNIQNKTGKRWILSNLTAQ